MSSFYCCFIPTFEFINDEEHIFESYFCNMDTTEHKYSKQDKIYTYDRFWCFCCFCKHNELYYNFNTSELIIIKNDCFAKKRFVDNAAVQYISFEDNNYLNMIKYIKYNNKLPVEDPKLNLNNYL